MKSKHFKIAAVILSLAVLFSCVMSVSATNYVVDVLSEDFESAVEFLAPGDLNADKALDASDVVALRKLLIEDETDGSYTAVFGANADAKYSDVNGDAAVNVKDLVRQKKVAASDYSVTADGALVLNGNSAYTGDLFADMGTGAQYKISFKYKATGVIKVKINAMGETIEVRKAAASNWKTAEATFTTPLEFAEGIDLQVIGVGSIDDLVITRINMDNEYSENW